MPYTRISYFDPFTQNTARGLCGCSHFSSYYSVVLAAEQLVKHSSFYCLFSSSCRNSALIDNSGLINFAGKSDGINNKGFAFSLDSIIYTF